MTIFVWTQGILPSNSSHAMLTAHLALWSLAGESQTQSVLALQPLTSHEALPLPPSAPAQSEQLVHTFASKEDLGEWREYFESVYGVETMAFPFSLRSLNFFYEDRLPQSVRPTLRVRRNKAQGGFWGWDDAQSGGPLRRGDLYRLFDTAHIFRCEVRFGLVQWMIGSALPLTPHYAI